MFSLGKDELPAGKCGIIKVFEKTWIDEEIVYSVERVHLG